MKWLMELHSSGMLIIQGTMFYVKLLLHNLLPSLTGVRIMDVNPVFMQQFFTMEPNGYHVLLTRPDIIGLSKIKFSQVIFIKMMKRHLLHTGWIQEMPRLITGTHQK